MNGGRSVAFVHPEFTLVGSARAVLTPEDAFDQGVGGLLDRLAPRLSSDATIMLTPGAAFAAGYPEQMPEHGIVDHPVLAQAKERGWNARALRQWTSFVRADQVIHVGLDPTVKTPQFPLRCRNEWETALALETWHSTTGKAWKGTPGIAGMSVLRGEGSGRAWATWKPTSGNPAGANEADYKRQHWAQMGSLPDGCPLIGYDANRMYLAAAGVVRLHPWTLKQTGAIPFDKKLSGWWLVELPIWDSLCLPDPSGRRAGEPAGPRWVTTPTLELIHEVTDWAPPVLDSWTGVGKAVLKEWATKLEAAWHFAEGTDDEGQEYVEALRQGVKSAYRWTIGSLNSPKSTIFRPDWHYSIIAMARANLWRKAHKVGEATGHWPVAIDVDNLIYVDTEEVEAEVPGVLAIGNRLGQFKTKEMSA